MNTSIGFRPCLALAPLLLAFGAFVVAAGCASHRKPQVTVLHDPLAALKQQFNANTSKPRVVALFSPTCGGCLYGAKALRHEARTNALARHAAFLVVWMPMLETDNEREGTKSARRYDFPGAHHFYDGEKRIGKGLMTEQFPSAIKDALEILPSDHPQRETLEKRKSLPPEKMPMWDALLVFPPGVTWGDRIPVPAWWTKQTSYIGEEKPGVHTALFWKNNTRQLPVKSNWFLEAREAFQVTERLTAKGQ
jgi:hypothetical protein